MKAQLLPNGNLLLEIAPTHPAFGRLARAIALARQGKPLVLSELMPELMPDARPDRRDDDARRP